eukprot:4954494-Pleurochrysis_carterae.AAC.2
MGPGPLTSEGTRKEEETGKRRGGGRKGVLWAGELEGRLLAASTCFQGGLVRDDRGGAPSSRCDADVEQR